MPPNPKFRLQDWLGAAFLFAASAVAAGFAARHLEGQRGATSLIGSALALGVGLIVSFLFLLQAGWRREAGFLRQRILAREEDIRALNADFKKRDAEATSELRDTGERLARFAAVVEATTDLVAMARMDGQVLFVNQAGRRMVGLAPDVDVFRMNVADFYPKWVVERFQQQGFAAAARDGTWSAELAVLHRDGREIPVSFVGLIIKSGDGYPEYMACIVRDITEQHRAAEELGAANAKLSRLGALISATSDFVAIGRLDGSVLFVNEAGRRMVGMAGDANLSGTRVGDFHPPAVLNLIEREGFPTMLREGAWHAEIALRHRDGHEIPVSIVGVVLKSPEGLPEYIGCVMRDISGQRQLEESLRSALAREKELNRLKSNFVSMVTHEIRTPLAHILGSSEILQRYLDRLPLEKREQHLQTIIDGVHRLSTLMEEVLLFSRAEAGRIEFNTEEIDLKAYCAQLVGEVAQATRHRCPVELDSEEFSIPARADENLMRHIFTNLLTNAVKYSASGTAVRFSIAREGVEAVFIVRDFGIGISEDDRKALFTPFYRGKNAVTLQGTGLGLVIVKHCVEHHGGTIEISSTEHQGTTVIVRLPLFEQAAANLARAPLPQNPPHP